MIIVLHGENTFERSRALTQLVDGQTVPVEKRDGAAMTPEQLADVFMGTTLFSQTRLVVIRGLANNKPMWEALPDWLDKISDDTTLILVEDKIDKRSKTYKRLQKETDMREFAAWTERDTFKAQDWAKAEAEKRGIRLSSQMVQLLVDRSGVDQWQLHYNLEKLSVLDEVTVDNIIAVVAAHPRENVFELFEAALSKNRQRLSNLLAVLQLNEDPYMVFGLLSGQAVHLATLAVSDAPSDQVAKDFGVHPFALKKLQPHASKMNRSDVRYIIEAFNTADAQMKSSSHNPWIAIERALMTVANRS